VTFKQVTHLVEVEDEQIALPHSDNTIWLKFFALKRKEKGVLLYWHFLVEC